MANKHRIDRRKVKEQLQLRGWYIGSLGHWETIHPKTDKQCSDDFYAAFEASIVCEEEKDARQSS